MFSGKQLIVVIFFFFFEGLVIHYISINFEFIGDVQRQL